MGDMFVSRFPTSHDAKESCGYRIELPDRTVGIATDTGVFSDAVFNGIKGCDLVLLESNYDSEMLRTGPYDELLKRRIRSETGHLSNDDCADAAVRLLESGTTRLVLGHLSRENRRTNGRIRALKGQARRRVRITSCRLPNRSIQKDSRFFEGGNIHARCYSYLRGQA